MVYGEHLDFTNREARKYRLNSLSELIQARRAGETDNTSTPNYQSTDKFTPDMPNFYSRITNKM